MRTDFNLSDEFVASYAEKDTPFGFVDMNGTSLGEITFIRTYARLKDDGTKERWHETVRRVIEGMYTIQKRHVRRNGLPWNGQKAAASAKAAYDSLYHLRWSPPGRGLWSMGTPLVMDEENAAPLQNCAFVSTSSMSKDSPGRVFGWMMEVSMVGVGVGFDDKGAGSLMVHEPDREHEITHVIGDTREEWACSLELLVNSYLRPNQQVQLFDYSEIRPAGEPIKRFGGRASGPEPLRKLHEQVRSILDARIGEAITAQDIADIGNLIGVCVVAGNVRRSAELLMGNLHDENFLHLKDYESEIGQSRAGWSYMSNNSVEAKVSDDLDHIVPYIVKNGEPGVIWMDTARAYGRLADEPDSKDWRIAGFNPCAEQGLESYEMCTLVETFPSRCSNLDEYLDALKYAYLYAKTVTLMKTPWEETNAIMLRNRRIGTSMTGLADFLDERGEADLVEWQDTGYGRIRNLDRVYSEWLAVRESVKTTTIKPSGTVSLLAGVTPGVHWQPGSEWYFRLLRFAADDPIVASAEAAGYRVDPDVTDEKGTRVVYFPMRRTSKRGEHEVSIVEKLNLAILSQKWWSDNAVSVTLSYSKAEESLIGPILKMARGNLKTVSFLPLAEGTYKQMPYTQATEGEITSVVEVGSEIDLNVLYRSGREAEGERGCSTDVCELKNTELEKADDLVMYAPDLSTLDTLT